MKIKDAMQAYNTQLDVLREKRVTLTKMLKDAEAGGSGLYNYDRVELSRELSSLDAQYEAVFNGREMIHETKNAIFNGEAAQQQSEAIAKAAEDMAKIMEVYRRIASGAKVPQKDEQKLMDYDFKLYMAAKQAALAAQQNDEEYDSLWDEEKKDEGERKDPEEIANETEIAVASPEAVAAEAAPVETADV